MGSDTFEDLKRRNAESAQEMTLIGKDLERVVHDTEPQFLELGSSLMDFAVRAKSISEDASSLAAVTSGSDITSDIEFFQQTLENFGSLCNNEECEQSFQDLSVVADIIAKLRVLIKDFGPIVKKLQMLGISVRIESARLGEGGSGFITLADDVEKLAEKITLKSDTVTGRCVSLNTLVVEALDSMKIILAGREESITTVETTLTENVSSLANLAENSREAAERIQSETEEVSGSIAHVVSSIQFHDIVRQQVEHVVEAVDEVLKLSISEATPDQEKLGYISVLSELQTLQLENAKCKFGSAVGEMINNLEGISKTVDRVVTEVKSLLEQDNETDGGGILESIERTTDDAVESMLRLTGSADELGAMMKSVAGMVGEITAFVEEIEDVGAEIELISLNASIKAAHTGEEGRALGVLASAVQTLSYEAMKTTQAVSEVLLKIAEVSEALESRSDNLLETETLKNILAEQQEHLRRMRAVGEETTDATRKVGASGQSLSQDITQLVTDIDFHEHVGSRLGDAAERFSALHGGTSHIVDEAVLRKCSESLRNLLSRYTMEEERLIHEKSLQGCEMPGAQSHNETNEQQDDWDNIELF